MINSKHTKIVATIGPATGKYLDILSLVNEGVDVCRINFSHGRTEEHKIVIDSVHKINKKYKKHVALLADLQGPKIRVGEILNNAIELKDGEMIHIITKSITGTSELISIDYNKLPEEINIDDRIFIDDGKIILKTLETNKKDKIVAQVIHGGVLSSRKGINLPDTAISQSSLSDKDLNDLRFIMENGFQWIALSFVRCADDIMALRKEMEKYNNKKNPLIVAKIEKPEALTDLDNIIEASDAVMVARGDLGIEIPFEKVPLIQKMIINKCLHLARPIIVATQMMESMINNFTPTRAEVNDVANSILDGTDAVMLSGETSVGKHPVEVIRNVFRIIQQIETFKGLYNKYQKVQSQTPQRLITDSLCHNACVLADQIEAKAIICMTNSGYTALKIASHRPSRPVYAFTARHDLLSKFSLIWGVKGYYYNNYVSSDKTIIDVQNVLLCEGLISKGDKIINLISMPISEKGYINTLKLSIV